MFKNCFLAVFCLTLICVAASAQDARTVIADTSKAMGAENLKTIQYSGPASEYAFGQAYNPSLPWPAFKIQSYTRSLDLQQPALRIDRMLEPIDPQRRGGGLPPAQSQTIVLTSATPWAQQVEIWKTPYGFLKAAAANNATARTQTVNGRKYTVVRFSTPSKTEVSGYINAEHMVERVETLVDNAVTGDTPLEVTYSDYKDFGGVKFPMRIVEKQGAYPTLELTVTDVKTNASLNIQPPQGRGGAPAAAPAAAPNPPATSQKLADGVYLILPGYAALAVDFKDYIVVIEGPQSDARANAIIAETKRVIPNKPIKYVVNTHAHFDHSSGLRAFVAEGSTIITHQVNKGYFEKALAGPHTLNPDRQATAKKKISVETIADKKILTDGNHVIELHRLQGNLHQEGLIVAYLPKEKILVEADSFNPPAQANAPPPTPVNPATLNLVENIERLKLNVETIVPVHYPADNRKVTMAELLKAAGKNSSN